MLGSGKRTEGHIRVQLDVLRRRSRHDRPYIQSIIYETDDMEATLASALSDINSSETLDIRGERVGEISWECSCLQKKCGACAMLIDSRPGLACAYRLKDHRGSKPLSIAPLSKFPVIADLMVDRSLMFENLRAFGMWAKSPVSLSGDVSSALPERRGRGGSDDAWEASRCLQCGCCLEVCPSFCPGDEFFGVSACIPAARLLPAASEAETERIRGAYMEHLYRDCARSLSCLDICPAGIDTEHLMVSLARSGLFRAKK